jgi:ADP-heptose:LPS heptosyltransferase
MLSERIPADFRPRTILVIRDSRVGDVLMTTPAIRRVHDRFPEAVIDVLTSRYAKRSGVLARNPCVRRVLSCPKNRLLKWLRCVLLPRYDLVIPVRRRPVFERIRAGCLVTGWEEPRSRHVVHGAEAGLGFPRDDRFVPMEIHPGRDELDLAAREIEEPAIGVYPSCHGASIGRADPMQSRRVWRADAAAAAVRGLQERGFPVILFGGSDEEGRELEGLGVEARVIAGGTITLLAARLARLAAFVTVDTGPMHVAAAMNVPIVALYGPTDPAVTGPYTEAGRSVILRDPGLECSPCRGKKIECHDNVCMTYHTPARILEALETLGIRPASGSGP